MRRATAFFAAAALCALLQTAVSNGEAALPEIRTTLENTAQVIEALLIPPAAPASRARAVHREVKVIKAGTEETEVRVETKPEDYVPGTLYTVFSRSRTGRLSASPLRVLAEVEPAAEEFPTSCQGDARESTKLESLPERSLKKLIDIRKRKKALIMERIRATLNAGIVERIAALEEAVGVSAGAPFSRALTDEELVQRILVLTSLTAGNQ